jgi:hypothetical protein
VLTPAQRVNDAEEANQHEEQADDFNAESEALAEMLAKVTVSQTEGVEAFVDDEDDVGTGPTVGHSSPANDDEAEAAGAPSATMAAALPDPMPAPEPAPNPAPRTAGHPAFSVLEQDRSRLEATIAELEAAVNSQPEDWEPDGSEAKPVVDWNAAKTTGSTFFSRRARKADTDDKPASEPTSVERPAAGLSTAEAPASIAPAEDAVSNTAPVSPAPTSEPAPVVAPVAADTSSQPEPDASSGPGETAATLRPGMQEDDIYWDEDALRRLVADVLREELQGELGERITRNVRKLVRREIYRAISSNE